MEIIQNFYVRSSMVKFSFLSKCKFIHSLFSLLATLTIIINAFVLEMQTFSS